MARGAEADIYLTSWHESVAVVKVRTPKNYRHKDLDSTLRKQRTIHEASIMSAAKLAGVLTPFLYFVNPDQGTIVMEFVSGSTVKNDLNIRYCNEMGRRAAALHASGIIHGDLTTSNFLVSSRGMVLLDFGLAHYSTRTEDMATDVRLAKEVLSSAHAILIKGFDAFVRGYESVIGRKASIRVMENVAEIERRGRYARLE